jgi:choline-sulfatase
MNNIVLITLDECTTGVLGCYGNQYAHTPNLDRFARNSVAFSSSFTVCPKCVPARAALLTGRYPHTDGHRTLPGFEVRTDENNVVSILKAAGYRTAMFGKNHTVDDRAIGHFFDVYHSGKGEKSLPKKRVLSPDNEAVYRSFYRGDVEDRTAANDWLAAEYACRYLENASPGPFFLLVNLKATHAPYFGYKPHIDIIRRKRPPVPEKESLESAPEILQKVRRVYDLEGLEEKDWRNIVEAYYSMASLCDECIGTILAKIDQLRLAENTTVIITADHGDFVGEHGCVEKWDTLFYDCLINTPLLVRHPGLTSLNTESDAFIETVDIAPGLLDLCGFEIPEWMHGSSFAPLLRGEEYEPKEYVFSEGGVEPSATVKAVPYDGSLVPIYPGYTWKQKIACQFPETMRRSKMVRNKEWKLIYRIDGSRELYNVREDPGEFRDVSQIRENKKVVCTLTNELLNWTIRSETDYPSIEQLKA